MFSAYKNLLNKHEKIRERENRNKIENSQKIYRNQVEVNQIENGCKLDRKWM